MKAKLKKALVIQQDQADCGVACLCSVLRYYGGDTSLETLRVLCGTIKTGTTLLGLYQGATKIGLKAKGIETDSEFLKTHNSPCILNVVTENQLSHFVVCFGLARIDRNGNAVFWIGDPGKGLVKMTEYDLNQVWNKIALKVDPSEETTLYSEPSKKSRNYF